MFRPTLLLALPIATLALAVPAFADGGALIANPAVYDVDASVAAGTACSLNVDAWVSHNGNDVAMVFSNLGFVLNGGAPTQTGACSVRLPVTVPANVFPDTVSQSFEYGGVSRTASATGSVQTSVRYFNSTIPAFGLTFDNSDAGSPTLPGHLHVRVAHEERFDRTSAWFSRWCAHTRPISGALQVDLRSLGRAPNPDDALTMFDGVDLRYEFTTTWQSCTP